MTQRPHHFVTLWVQWACDRPSLVFARKQYKRIFERTQAVSRTWCGSCRAPTRAKLTPCFVVFSASPKSAQILLNKTTRNVKTCIYGVWSEHHLKSGTGDRLSFILFSSPCDLCGRAPTREWKKPMKAQKKIFLTGWPCEFWFIR